jgi:hypothetical protein
MNLDYEELDLLATALTCLENHTPNEGKLQERIRELGHRIVMEQGAQAPESE